MTVVYLVPFLNFCLYHGVSVLFLSLSCFISVRLFHSLCPGPFLCMCLHCPYRFRVFVFRASFVLELTLTVLVRAPVCLITRVTFYVSLFGSVCGIVFRFRLIAVRLFLCFKVSMYMYFSSCHACVFLRFCFQYPIPSNFVFILAVSGNLSNRVHYVFFSLFLCQFVCIFIYVKGLYVN